MSCQFAIALAVVFLMSASFGQTSRNGEVSAHVSTKGGAKNKREHNTWTAEVVYKNGTKRYQLNKEVSFDVQFPSIYPADNGSCVVVNVFDGLVEFYDHRGSLIKTFRPFGKPTTEHEQVIKCSVAGDRVAVLFSAPESANATLVMMTVAGEELWRASPKGKKAAEVYLSSNSKFVAAGSYTMAAQLVSVTQTFGEDGKEMSTFSKAFRCADISNDGLIAFSDRNSITLASVSAGQPMFTWNTKQKEDIVTAVKLVSNFVASSVENVSAESGTPMYHNPALIILNRKGDVVSTQSLTGSSQKPSKLIASGGDIILSSSTSTTKVSLKSLKE